MEPRLILINLLIKLGVAAAVSSTLVRSKEFKSLLFREERTFRQKMYLVLWFALPIMLGVLIRISQPSFQASDVSFETAMLLGVIGGRWAGSLGGALVSVPALIVSGEHDTILPSVLTRRIAEKMPNARHVEVPGAAHLVPLEVPNAANSLILDFIRE